MKRLYGWLQLGLLIVPMVPYTAASYTLIATETARAEWENGKVSPETPQFSYRFEIDETSQKARLTELVRLKNNRIIEVPLESSEYQVTYIAPGSEASASLRDAGKRNQKIVALIGFPGELAFETVLIGETFFEYCKGSAGRFYLSSGNIKRAVSLEEDSIKMLREGESR